MMKRCLIVLLGVLVSAAGSAQQRPAPEAPPPPVVNALSRATSWAYQLQKVSPGQISTSPFDVAVIDYSRNGTHEKRFKPVDVKWMKRKPDGGERIVLAYMSLGEAEDYRFYWDEKWIETATPDEEGAKPQAPASAGATPTPAQPMPKAGAKNATSAVPPPAAQPGGKAGEALAPQANGKAAPAVAAPPAKPDRWLSPLAPAWLGDENDRWTGNFEVKYWEKGWQDIIFGSANSYLEHIIAAGFDGVYLDRVDAFYQFQEERPTAIDEMVDFVARLSAHAKKLKAGFLIVPQNGEELLLRADYVKAIDGLAKEDLFFGGPGNGQRNNPLVVGNSLNWLRGAEARRLPIFVVEYLDKPDQIAEARKLIEARGYVAYFGIRDLDQLVLPAGTGASGKQGAPSAPPAASGRANPAAKRKAQ